MATPTLLRAFVAQPNSTALSFASLRSSSSSLAAYPSAFHRRSSFSSSSSRSMGSVFSSQKPEQAQEQGTTNYAGISEDEWKQRLTEDQYYITRQKGTERAFTGEYWNAKTPGTYHCICCDTPLFKSRTKFESGTGWPSFYEPIGDNVKSKLDMSIIFMPRTEVLCNVCNAHLGHVFDDGPTLSGKRYCINSVSLRLRPQQQ